MSRRISFFVSLFHHFEKLFDGLSALNCGIILENELACVGIFINLADLGKDFLGGFL